MKSTKYYEFTTDIAPYYALIAVTTSKNGVTERIHPQHKATELYTKQVADLLDEHSAYHFGGNLISKEEAFYKYAVAEKSNATADQLLTEFDSIENGVLLVEGTLL